MHHQEFEPAEALRDTIKCFWYDRDVADPATGHFEVMPDGYAEIIFYFGHLYNDTYADDTTPFPSPFIMGLLNQPALFRTKDRLEIIGIRCYPWTVFDLLGLPPDKESVYTFEHPIAKLQPVLEQYVQAGRINEALHELTQYLLEVRSHVPADSMLYKAGAAMRKANGAMRVDQIATAAHTTVRTLERKFRQSSGHTVKDVSGLIRFEQARNHLWMHPDANLAGLAYELGYTDQSHLSKEFKKYSGSTPGSFARKARQRQATNRNFVAFIQS